MTTNPVQQEKTPYLKKRENAANFWKYMHTMAAYYPEHPSNKEKKHMNFFIENCADYFLNEPKWAERFNKNIKLHPAKLDSRDAFMVWMCEQHNFINDSIGKPIYPCLIPNLVKRWGPVSLPEENKNNNKQI